MNFGISELAEKHLHEARCGSGIGGQIEAHGTKTPVKIKPSKGRREVAPGAAVELAHLPAYW
jgi:hypothetical protein